MSVEDEALSVSFQGSYCRMQCFKCMVTVDFVTSMSDEQLASIVLGFMKGHELRHQSLPK